MTKQLPDVLKASRRTVWSLLAVTLAGVILTAIFFWTTRSAELNGFKSQFEHDASNRANLVNDKLDDCLLVIRALQGYYNSSDLVERKEFKTFAAPFLPERKELQALTCDDDRQAALREQGCLRLTKQEEHNDQENKTQREARDPVA